jgi:hypothetical protein
MESPSRCYALKHINYRDGVQSKSAVAYSDAFKATLGVGTNHQNRFDLVLIQRKQLAFIL